MKYIIELKAAEKQVICNLIGTIRDNSSGEHRLFEDTTLCRFDEKSTDYDVVYRKGIEDGNKMADKDLKEIQDSIYDVAYNKGLEDASTTAWTMLTSVNTDKIFPGYTTISEILGNVPMREIRHRIKAYEEKKNPEKEIKVGDEVKSVYDNKIVGIVTKVNHSTEKIRIFFSDGSGGMVEMNPKDYKRTGRNFSAEIEQLLDKLKGKE